MVPQSLGVEQPPPQAVLSAPRSGILELAAGPGLCSLAAPVTSRRVSCTVTFINSHQRLWVSSLPPTLAAGTLSTISHYSITALCLEYTCFPIIPQTKPNTPAFYTREEQRLGLSRWLSGKEYPCNIGDLSLIPVTGRSLEKGMANHSSILAWEIPRTEEPGRLQPMGFQRVGHSWATNTFIFLFLKRGSKK